MFEIRGLQKENTVYAECTLQFRTFKPLSYKDWGPWTDVPIVKDTAHNWKYVPPAGMYESTYKCTRCNRIHIQSIDDEYTPIDRLPDDCPGEPK